MARESHTLLGSGTMPFIASIRDGVVLSDGSEAEGYRVGTNVVITNPEDLYSSPILAMSGMTIASDATVAVPSIFIQYAKTQFHRREIDIFNIGPAPYLLVYYNSNLIDEYCWPIKAGESYKFKVMDNTDIYVKASGAETDIRWTEN